MVVKFVIKVINTLLLTSLLLFSCNQIYKTIVKINLLEFGDPAIGMGIIFLFGWSVLVWFLTIPIYFIWNKESMQYGSD